MQPPFIIAHSRQFAPTGSTVAQSPEGNHPPAAILLALAQRGWTPAALATSCSASQWRRISGSFQQAARLVLADPSIPAGVIAGWLPWCGPKVLGNVGILPASTMPTTSSARPPAPPAIHANTADASMLAASNRLTDWLEQLPCLADAPLLTVHPYGLELSPFGTFGSPFSPSTPPPAPSWRRLRLAFALARHAMSGCSHVEQRVYEEKAIEMLSMHLPQPACAAVAHRLLTFQPAMEAVRVWLPPRSHPCSGMMLRVLAHGTGATAVRLPPSWLYCVLAPPGVLGALLKEFRTISAILERHCDLRAARSGTGEHFNAASFAFGFALACFEARWDSPAHPFDALNTRPCVPARANEHGSAHPTTNAAKAEAARVIASLLESDVPEMPLRIDERDYEAGAALAEMLLADLPRKAS